MTTTESLRASILKQNLENMVELAYSIFFGDHDALTPNELEQLVNAADALGKTGISIAVREYLDK